MNLVNELFGSSGRWVLIGGHLDEGRPADPSISIQVAKSKETSAPFLRFFDGFYRTAVSEAKSVIRAGRFVHFYGR